MKPKTKAKAKRRPPPLSISIDSDLKAKLALVAEREDRSVSSVARRAIELYIGSKDSPEAVPA
ncbi:MAG TPA: ribbon-helix-helix protein, CopG family [Chloroflexota bacterium]|nr:ribbon-helix-helix protein, CopG family [Chloroflexota bacterium]